MASNRAPAVLGIAIFTAIAEALSFAFGMTWEITWALVLGFTVSAVVQAVVSKESISRLLPDDSPRSLAIACGLGIASSSCSYAAVALARSLFRKGANFTASMAFEFASTNLVIELGIILWLLLGWQFAVAEFVGGPVMIVILAALFRRALAPELLEEARAQADRGLVGSMEGHAEMDMSVRGGTFVSRIASARGLTAVSHSFVMDWAAIWKDIVGGLLIAGALAAWVPESFWQGFFLVDHPVLARIWGPLIGPLVSMLSFVCSIGNVPLAAVLWNGGISFGGVAAFIYADLIVLPILNIYRKYYGRRMTRYLLATFYAAMVAAGLVVELLFGVLDLVPEERTAKVVEASVSWNYTTILNIVFLVLAAVLVVRFLRTGGPAMLRMMDRAPRTPEPERASVAHHGSSEGRQPMDVVYTCPMHPEVESSEPGRCPKCGMDLQPKDGEQGGRLPSDRPGADGILGRHSRGSRGGSTSMEHAGHGSHAPAEHEHHAGGQPTAHDEHAGHSVAMFRDRFWLSVLLTLPILVWSETVQGWFGYSAPSFPFAARIPAIFGTIVFVYGGMPFLKGGVREIRDRQLGMMLLISLAIVVAFVSSLASETGALDLEFWWELALLIDVMLLGHWQEMKALGQASGALEALAALLPDEAEIVEANGSRTAPLHELEPGVLVLVRSGGRVPADGTIEEGSAEFDESMITGESKPIFKDVGDGVVAGTIATDSSVRIRVSAVGEDTTLAGIRRLVMEAQSSRSRAQALADRAAAALFYVAVAAGVLTFGVWTSLGSVDEAVERSVTVLVISCPHALGLAIPLVIAISTSVSARAGILVKDRLALERMRTVDTVLFDKTGTLTKGTPVVTDVASADGSRDEVLALAAAVESDSEHPLARAIVSAAIANGPVPQASGFRSLTGRGVLADVDGAAIAVGGPALLRERQLTEPTQLAGRLEEWRARGASVLMVVRGDQVIGALALEDEVRPESVEAVRLLHDEGIRVVMITGDAREVADAVGADVGVDEVLAEVLPEHKDGSVVQLQGRGLRIAMVGDGVNDAPALARADVGIAIGAGTDVAIESAGVVLASDDPRGVVSVRRLSKASYRKMLQNLGWALGYNVIAIPLAAGTLAWAGVVFPPAVGALAMSVSTIVVAVNAMLLRNVDLRPGRSSAPAARTPARRTASHEHHH